MGKLYRYQPTLGMSKEERTEANYITKILSWLHSAEDLLTTVASISYTEKGCMLTPLAENINGKPIAIEVSGSNITYSTKTGNASPAWSSGAISLTNDPFLYIASDTDGISVGGGTTPWMMGIYMGHLFDGTEIGIEVDTSGSDLIWFPKTPAIRNTPIGQGESTRLFPTVEAHDHSVIVKIYRIYESINHYSLVVIAYQVK